MGSWISTRAALGRLNLGWNDCAEVYEVSIGCGTRVVLEGLIEDEPVLDSTWRVPPDGPVLDSIWRVHGLVLDSTWMILLAPFSSARCTSEGNLS